MIRYRLLCDEGHEFEGWFQSSAAFDDQKADGQVQCPVCGTASVAKAIMAPGIVGRSPAQVSTAPETEKPSFVSTMPPEMQELLRKVRRYVRENTEYVGDRFADEARMIHYEESAQRGIYGEATSEEVRALVEEGIEVHPVPALPEDRN